MINLYLFLFKGNEKLTWMNLNHNKFSEKSGENLGQGISKLGDTRNVLPQVLPRYNRNSN